MTEPPAAAPRAALSRWVFGLCACVALTALAYGTWRVMQLERSELDYATPPRTLNALRNAPHATRISVRLGEAKLHAGEQAVFEVCASDGLPAKTWQGALDFAVIQLEAKQLMLRIPLDAAHLGFVRRNSAGGCLLVGRGPIVHSGTYSVEAVWPAQPPPAAVLDVALQLRVLSKTSLVTRDRLSVTLLGCAVLGLLGWRLRSRTRTAAQRDATHSPQPAWWRFGQALAALGLLLVLSHVASPAPSLTLLKGSALFATQVGLAWWLARGFAGGDSERALGLVRPAHVGFAALAGALAWPLLVATARLSLRLVPSTGEAPIETFISWPSGMLAAALLGVLLPLAEELFFRGYLYGALLPMGRAAAAIVSTLLFGLLHASQSWGNWGGLFAVFAAGAVLCALRVMSGSTLVSAVTHVAYNLSLSVASIAASQ